MAKNDGSGEELLTLTEVSERTGISMPTLQRYKKSYQNRIPSEGKGRKQRYPVSALPVFEEIKKENIAKRGRPKKKGSGTTKSKKRGRRTPPPKRKGGGDSTDRSELLTLTRIEELTGISYPTLVRYVKNHGDEIPHEGEGRRRRYYPEAVEKFKELRGQSRRGGRRRKKAAGGRTAGAGRSVGASTEAKAAAAAAAAVSKQMEKRLSEIEKSQKAIEKKIDQLIKGLKRPLLR